VSGWCDFLSLAVDQYRPVDVESLVFRRVLLLTERLQMLHARAAGCACSRQQFISTGDTFFRDLRRSHLDGTLRSLLRD
jgi:hypothetical protein